MTARQNYPIFRKKCAQRQLKAGFFSYPFIKIFDLAHFALPYIICIFIPIISAARHLVYHDVLTELLSTELWGVRQSNDAGSANGPDNLQTLQTCACFLWPMSLGANSHTQATGNGRAKQLFLKTSWFLSVLLNGVLHGLAAPQFACFREAI